MAFLLSLWLLELCFELVGMLLFVAVWSGHVFRFVPHRHRSHQETVVPSQSPASLSKLESSFSYSGALEE